jgi:hypothetical protein
MLLAITDGRLQATAPLRSDLRGLWSKWTSLTLIQLFGFRNYTGYIKCFLSPCHPAFWIWLVVFTVGVCHRPQGTRPASSPLHACRFAECLEGEGLFVERGD